MTIDERIREGLEAAANTVPRSAPRPLEDVEKAGGRRRTTRLAGLSGAALGAASLIVALAMIAVNQGPQDSAMSLGEMTVVDGSPGPAPEFDTSQLGPDVSLSPITNVDAVLEAVEAEDRATGSFQGGDTFRVALLGETPSGEAVYVTHSIAEISDVTIQNRCVWTTLGGQCSGMSVSDLEPGELVQPSQDGPFAMPGYTVGGRGDLTWEVSTDTSVAMVTVDGERTWMRPVDQVAVFILDLRGGERVFVTAFDREGSVLSSNSFVADITGEPAASSCPITVPDGSFTPPAGYPDARPGDVWFGTSELWTVLPVDGHYPIRKSVWWSEAFPGGAVEEQPPITVRWNRLDAAADPITASDGTNAYTAEDGWFMIAGIDPQEAGCWEVTAEYKGVTLSYVYEQT